MQLKSILSSNDYRIFTRSLSILGASLSETNNHLSSPETARNEFANRTNHSVRVLSIFLATNAQIRVQKNC